jgi:hypothetical protein
LQEAIRGGEAAKQSLPKMVPVEPEKCIDHCKTMGVLAHAVQVVKHILNAVLAFFHSSMKARQGFASTSFPDLARKTRWFPGQQSKCRSAQIWLASRHH